MFPLMAATLPVAEIVPRGTFACRLPIAPNVPRGTFACRLPTLIFRAASCYSPVGPIHPLHGGTHGEETAWPWAGCPARHRLDRKHERSERQPARSQSA